MSIHPPTRQFYHPALSSERARKSLQLEQFRNFNFSSMKRELDALFSVPFPLRNVPLAYRASVDGAGQYDKPAMREWPGASSLEQDRVNAVYRDLRVHKVLQNAEQAGVLQNSYLLGCWPDQSGRLRLHTFLPYQIVDVVISDPDASEDITAADLVVLARTVRRQNGPHSSSAWVALIELSATEAWHVLPDGVRVGVFAPDGHNPLGRIPLVYTARTRPTVDPSQGTLSAVESVVPEVSDDILSCQIGISIACSRGENVTLRQSHVKVIVSGEDSGDTPIEVQDRPDGIIVLPGDVTVQALALQPSTDKLIRAAETTMHFLSQFRYFRPEAYQASIVTGSARRADALGFDASQQRGSTRCDDVESDLYDLVRDVYNATQRTALKLPDVPVKVTHRYVKSAENALQEQQALRDKLANLMTDHITEIAREEGISEDAARKLAERRLKDLVDFASPKAGEAPPVAVDDAVSIDIDQLDEATEPMLSDEAADVQDTALNGAQIQSLEGIVKSVSAREMAPEAAKIVIRKSFPTISESEVAALVDAAAAYEPGPRQEKPLVFNQN